MKNTVKSVSKYQADKKEIIMKLISIIYAVRGATTPCALAETIKRNLDRSRTRADKLTAQLSLLILDYLHSL